MMKVVVDDVFSVLGGPCRIRSVDVMVGNFSGGAELAWVCSITFCSVLECSFRECYSSPNVLVLDTGVSRSLEPVYPKTQCMPQDGTRTSCMTW